MSARARSSARRGASAHTCGAPLALAARISVLVTRAAAALAWCVLLAAGAAAGASRQRTEDLGSPQRPTLRSQRIEFAEAPRIDGVLDDEVWQRAGRATGFVQVAPVDGAPPTFDTEVLVAHDADLLYVALVCHDREADVRARQMDRDAFVRYDDVVELWFDTFADERSAFWFQITPAGSRGDALIADGGTSFNKQWDGIWYGRATVTADGWQAELAFPFQTLSFDPNVEGWGFNLRRRRVASGEETRWAASGVAYGFFALTEGGRLTGLEGVAQGRGVDVVGYAKGSAARASADASSETELDGGLDVRWRPTPASALRLTFNTDFAETEVDDRQVNLERFPLFFPEKRAFFLEDAGIFEFGAPMLRSTVVPFFSRRVGRADDGEAVPILAGAKFTGRIGDWTLGGLGASLDAADGVDAQGVAVARVSRSLGEGRAVGGLFTAGDPSDGNAATFGIDARFGSPRFFGPGHSAYLWTYLLGTTGDGADDEGRAFGVQAQTQSRSFRHDLQLQRVDAGFDPALGFVRRAGIEQGRWEARYTWRSDDASSWLRQYNARIAPTWTWDQVGGEDGFALPVQLFDATLVTDDRVELEVHHISESLDGPFTVGGAATAPAGDYDMRRWFFEFETNDRRRVAGLAAYEWGDYFGGRISRLRLEPLLIPHRYFSLGLAFQDVAIDLDSGDYRTQLYGWRVGVTFSPDLAWKTLVQYDTESKDLGVQSRLHWIVQPGQDLYFVVNAGFTKASHDAAFRSEEQQATLKLSYTWRF
ncbi:MAG: DUF5916 domain-containing protein [Planctomycetota bacterium]